MVQCYKKGDRTTCKYISKHWPRTNVQSNQKYIFKLKINNKYFKRRKLFGQLKNTHNAIGYRFTSFKCTIQP